MIYHLETDAKNITIGKINDTLLVSCHGKTYTGNVIVYCEKGPCNLLTLNKIGSLPEKGKILLLFQKGKLIFGSAVIKKITTK